MTKGLGSIGREEHQQGGTLAEGSTSRGRAPAGGSTGRGGASAGREYQPGYCGLGLSGRNEGTLAAHSYLSGQGGIATLPTSHVSLGSQVRQQGLHRQVWDSWVWGQCQL